MDKDKSVVLLNQDLEGEHGVILQYMFHSYMAWNEEFKRQMEDQAINEHETAHLAGCTPISVMDVFEHAFITDYELKRADYTEAFFKNINWGVVEGHLQ